MGSLGVNIPALIVVGISLVVGLLMVVVFRYTSDQKAIHVAKDHLKAHLLALRLFQDQIPVVLRSYGRILLATGRYLRLAFMPLLFVIVPLTLVIVQLDRYLGSTPVEQGHAFLITAKVADRAALDATSLELPDGLAVTAPAVHIPAENEVAWRVTAAKDGNYIVDVKASGQTLSKSLVVGSGFWRLSPVRLRGNSWSASYFQPSPLFPRTVRLRRSRCSILQEISLSRGLSGIGSGCSSFCRWSQAFSSRAVLGIEI